ncbi:MAG: hypothetical protein GC206_04805 [Alphaproteobacteria bacterium]|nr:hypothetical protein [Alphaproteobacteria bacterium]
MRVFLISAALAGAVALSACETTGGYGGGGGSQLSRCGQNAVAGAVVGGLIGLATAPRGNRGENAAIGAAVGGLGTYAVCSWLQARDRANIERGYQQALAENRSVNSSWQSEEGDSRAVYVNPPTASDRGPECRRVTATVQHPEYGRQELPPETYCRNAMGEWVPV